MIRFDLPDGATEEEVEAYLASLHESARHEVRRLIEAGASAEEINAFIEETEEQLDEEDAAELEEVENRAP